MRARTVTRAYSPALNSWLAWLPSGIQVVGNSGGLELLDPSRQYRGTVIRGRRIRLSV